MLERMYWRTSTLRKEETQLLISFQKPHKAVSRYTNSRSIKSVIEGAGIDVDLYEAHTTRSASSSYAKQNNTTIDVVIKTAGWENNKTLHVFYDKAIMIVPDSIH